MKNALLFNLTMTFGLTLFSIVCAANMAEDPKTSVWKISKGDDAVFIGGTIHILPISEFPLPNVFTETYKKSDTLVFEVEIPAPSDVAGQHKMMAQLAYSDGKTLKDHISDDTYNALDKYLSAFGTNADQVAHFKPGMVTSMLVVMEAQRSQLAGDGIDVYFMKRAEQDNKTIEYLETMEFQTKMLANMGAGEEDRLISETLETLPELESLLKDTINAWRQGNTKQIDALIIDTFKRESPKSFEDVFTERNKNWIPQIEAMFGDDDQEFVLVGAGHLVGDGSVIALLEAKGYKIEQM